MQSKMIRLVVEVFAESNFRGVLEVRVVSSLNRLDIPKR